MMVIHISLLENMDRKMNFTTTEKWCWWCHRWWL